MIGRLLAWIRRQREWTRAHRAAWKGAADPVTDGFSVFQIQCEAAIASSIAADGHTLIDRTIHSGQSMKFISATISGTQLEVWIYPDQVNLGGIDVDERFEKWDAVSPAELIDKMCRTMLEHLPKPPAHAV